MRTKKKENEHGFTSLCSNLFDTTYGQWAVDTMGTLAYLCDSFSQRGVAKIK